jgi:hypothetical protein
MTKKKSHRFQSTHVLGLLLYVRWRLMADEYVAY